MIIDEVGINLNMAFQTSIGLFRQMLFYAFLNLE
jgi:hypothetical protein